MANGYDYIGQPVIISEYGGFAFNNDDNGWSYGNKVNTEEDFIKRFGMQMPSERLMRDR